MKRRREVEGDAITDIRLRLADERTEMCKLQKLLNPQDNGLL
jgi:hypothetical protein